MEQNTREVKLNIFIGVLNQLLSLGINFFSKQAIQCQLGTEYLGLQSVFSSICDLLVFAFSGVGIAMLFQLYRPFEEQNRQLLSAVFHFFNRIYRILTAAAVVIGICATGFVLWAVNADIPKWEIVQTYLLYLSSVITYNRYIIYYYYLMADQRRYIACAVYGLVDFTALIFEILILRWTRNYGCFLLCIVLKNIVANVIFSIYIRRHYPYLNENTGLIEKEHSRAIFRDIKDMVISRIGGILLNNTDSLLLSSIVSTVVAGCYSNYYFTFSGILAIITSFFDSLMSKIGQKIVQDTETQQFLAYLKTCVANIAIVAVCVSGYYWLTQEFITLWMNQEVLLGHEVVIITSIRLYMEGMRHTASTYRQAAGIFQKVSGLILFRGILNLIISVFCGLRFGTAGILSATILADIATVYWFEPYVIYRHYHRTYFYELLYQAAGIAVTLSTIWITGRAISLIHQLSWLSLICKGLLLVASSFLWLAILAVFALPLFKLAEKRFYQGG